MNSFSLSIFVLILWSQVALGKEKVLKFQHTRYATALKENHKIGKTSIFFKAHGCKDVKYKIQEKQMLEYFKVDGYGRLHLRKRLDFNKDKSYHFIVSAKSSDKNCMRESALTWVNIEVLNVNVHRPEFNKNEYHCKIDEKTGRVKISPDMIVKDQDSGDAGKIQNVQFKYVHSSVPFYIEFKQSTGHVVLRPLPNVQFDADRLSSYKMTLQAWDAGDPPKNSRPVQLHCGVVPQNKYAPVFSKKEYIGRLKQSATKADIIKVEAIDDDSNDVFGKVCEYFIHTSDIPFSISHEGMISLPKPLPKDPPDNYVFGVMAKDCGGKVSEEATMVNVIVDKDCAPGFVTSNKVSPKLKGCAGRVAITPHIRLNTCGESRQYANYSASVTMDTGLVLKGCDRETYEGSGIFKMCSVNKFVDLLPPAKENHDLMAALVTDESTKAENIHDFTNKRAIDVPSDVQYDGHSNMTLSTWIWMKRQEKRQFIIAASDAERLDRKHFGLFTQGDNLVFIHRQEGTSNNDCKSQFAWKPKIFDTKWHHVVITVYGCKTARLFVDSKEVPVAHVKADWPLHNSHMQKRLVIGARWLGREMKYDDHFEGYLSGLSMNTREAVSEKAIKCVYECKEKVKIDIRAPDGFEIKHKSHNVIEINGRGRPETFEKLLRSLVYVNNRQTPTTGRRSLQIQTSINRQALPMLSMGIVVESGDVPKLTLSGGERKKTSVAELSKYGVPIGEKVIIESGKCSKYLDFAKIEVEPPLTAHESLENLGPFLNQYNLKKEVLPKGKGFLVRGLAKIAEYQKILRETVFVHLAPTERVYHKFKFSVSDMNSRFVSNVLETELTTDTSPRYDMQAMNRQEKDALPGAVTNEVLVAKTSGQSLGVVVGIIIAASCSLVFIILVVAFRLRGIDTSVVYTDVPENEAEVTSDGQTVMNVTLNPLEKLEAIHGQENENEEDESKPKAKNEKMTLEWDDAYIA